MRRLLLVALFLPSCALTHRELPVEAPPLADLEEPLDLRQEPDDEAARVELPAGSFTGVHVADARTSLDALASEAGGLAVGEVVENSPADFAGLLAGDQIVEVRAGGEVLAPRWPSEWRELELATPPGSHVVVVVDRAGVERELEVVTEPRAHPAGRAPAERYREEQKVGLVVRTATEVEARAAGLGPGGGAVVVGLARASPWRAAGLVYLDVIRAVDGEEVAHPQVVLDAIRAAEPGQALDLEIVRAGAVLHVSAPLSERASEVRDVDVPFLFSYTNERGRSETSFLLGLYYREATATAWRVRLLWFVSFSGGDADRLASEGGG